MASGMYCIGYSINCHHRINYDTSHTLAVYIYNSNYCVNLSELIKEYRMSQDNKVCKIYNATGHSKFYCKNKPIKPIKRTPIKRTSKKNLQVVGKPKTRSRSKLKKDLDKLVKYYIKLRDNYTCQWCNKVVSGKSCQGSHVFSVGSCSLLQFEPLNIKVLCAYCHRRRWHSSPPEAMAWFGNKFPERLAILEEMKLTKTKISTYQLQQMIEEYKEKIKNLS